MTAAVPPPSGYDLLELTVETAPRWFAFDPSLPATETALSQVREVLAGGPLAPALLLVAMKTEQPVARFQAVLDAHGKLGVWMPEWRADLDDATGSRLIEAMLTRVLATARQRPECLYAETELPATLGAPLWRQALARHGFHSVSRYRLYDRQGLGGPALPEAPDVTWRAAATLPERELAGLLGAIRTESADRTHRRTPESAAQQWHRLHTIPLLDPNRCTRRVAFIADRPAGLVLTAMENADFGVPSRGWILEIGVLPEFRGKGLGARLLSQALSDLAAWRAETVRARIDEENLASIRLHAAAGFVATEEAFDVFWHRPPTLGAWWRGWGRRWRG